MHSIAFRTYLLTYAPVAASCVVSLAPSSSDLPSAHGFRPPRTESLSGNETELPPNEPRCPEHPPGRQAAGTKEEYSEPY